ncbi:LGFP repeat-containing protein [uncultured Microbacterium sp.]|uniref:LGFP repeat-containing protein n=1 Tax=uncultured Microbacterium sp. TaxID=191216 RepID=UPI0035C966E3
MTEFAHVTATATPTGGTLADGLGSPIDQSGLSAQPGPGDTALGTFADAVRFGAGAHAQLTATPALADRERFALRVSFAARGAVTARQNLVEATHVPAVLWIEAGADAASIRLGAGVQTPAGAWRTVVSDDTLAAEQWQCVALVLDDDVLAVIDETTGALLAAVALPEAALGVATGTSLSIGTLPDGAGLPFAGDIAAVIWQDEIAAALDSVVDDWRMSPAGIIDAKRWALPFDVGAALGNPEWDGASGTTLRRFAGADIRFSEDAGNAFEMHGGIRAEYDALEHAALLGFPVSDEIAGAADGVRKNLFSQGAIYWTQQTGALPVFEEFYAAYESGDMAPLLGPPVEPEEDVAGGLVQRFARGELYLAAGSTTAFQVGGAILAAYSATGGPERWGLPTTSELPVLRSNGSGELGRLSTFGGATFYWSPSTGAHVVYGAIGAYYAATDGPRGRLGFPTSDELALPGAPGARYNTFERGCVLWYPDTGIIEPTPLRVMIGTVNTQEDEGFGRGQNDLTIDVGLLKDGVGVDGFQDVTDGHNIRTLDRALGVNIEPWPGRSYTLRVDVHERDPEDRPQLGLWEKVLDAGNGWGLRENSGILDSGRFSQINSITASVAPLPPAGGFTLEQRHWGTNNPSTAEISRTTYATAFPEVDSEPEWWDIADGIESIYYELVSKGLSAHGNCMGFSAEGALSEKGSSLYQMPLSRFTQADWERGLERHINVRHQSQVGAVAIWNFVTTFLTGNTHDPVDVFRTTRDAYTNGQPPVICLAQNYDFSGAPHVVRPIAWHQNGSQWEIDVFDPNFVGAPRKIMIDSDANTFTYSGGSDYSGGEWSGGRLYYLPFHAFSGSAELPVWDALRLIVGGTIAIMGDGDAATAVTTPAGENLLLTGAPSREPAGSGPNGFVPVPNYERGIDQGAVPLVRRIDVEATRILGKSAEIKFNEVIDAHIFDIAAVAEGILARSRRELSTHRRGPRGIHRGVRDLVQGLKIPKYIVPRERPHREDLKTGILELAKIRMDDNPVFLTTAAARESVVEAAGIDVGEIATRRRPAIFDAKKLQLNLKGALGDGLLGDGLLGGGAVTDSAALRNEFITLAAQLPEGDQREAVVELASNDSPLDLLAGGDFRARLDLGLASDIGSIIKGLYDDDFVLDTVSRGRGGRIAIAHALRDYVVRHDGARGSAMRIAGEHLRSTANTLRVAPGSGRKVTLTVTNRVGLQGDVIRARFVDLPAESAAPLTLNVRPGIARWELAGETLQGSATAIVSGIIGGRRFGASYDLTLQSALRIQLPLAADAARLSVATTTGLFADATSVTKVSPR